MITKKYLTDLTYLVAGCAIEVHRTLGPGLIESVYEKCLYREFQLRGINYSEQLHVPVVYKGLDLNAHLRLDALVEDVLCVELKAQELILPVHEAVLLSYMQMLQKPKGIMINFHCVNIYMHGQKTFVNQLFANLPDI